MASTNFDEIIMPKFILMVSLVLLLCNLFASGNPARLSILDESAATTDIETVVQVACEKFTGSSKQIAHISTILKLTDYLRAASDPSHDYYDCSQKYLNSLEDLVEVLSTANESVCGDKKLKLIENYHQKYVSKVRKHVQNQKRSSKVPKVVRLFFMQYASEISTQCEWATVEMLAEREGKISVSLVEKMDKLKSFFDALGMSDLSKGYESIYLLWNMIDNLPLEEDEKFSQYLEAKGSSSRLNVQLNNPESFALVQALCRSNAKPIYDRTILPVLRLTDMGYYPRGEDRLTRDFQNPKSAAHSLLVVTQICETILPLRAYQDQQLKQDQIVALTKDEAAQLKPFGVPERIHEELRRVSEKLPVETTKEISWAGLNRLPAVHVGEARERVEMIKSNVESRSHIMAMMFRVIMRSMKNKISFGKFMLSRKNESDSLDETDLELELDEEVSANNMRIRRDTTQKTKKHKNLSLWKKTKMFAWKTGRIVAKLLLWLVYLILGILFVVSLIVVEVCTLGGLHLMSHDS